MSLAYNDLTSFSETVNLFIFSVRWLRGIFENQEKSKKFVKPQQDSTIELHILNTNSV